MPSYKVPPKGFFIYTHPSFGWSQYYLDGEKLLSVSKVKESIGDGPGLQYWAANMERDAVLEAAAKTFDGYMEQARLTIAAGVIPEQSGAQFSQMVHETLKTMLGGERKKAFEVKRDEAADVGRNVHAALEWDFNAFIGKEQGDRPTLEDPREQTAYEAARKWLKEFDVVPLVSERPVYSPRLKVAGRLDKVALVRGIPAVVDYKVTNSVGWSHRFTTAAYATLYNDCPDKIVGVPEIRAGLVLQLPKIPEAPVMPYAIPGDEVAFLAGMLEDAARVRRSLDAMGVFDRR